MLNRFKLFVSFSLSSDAFVLFAAHWVITQYFFCSYLKWLFLHKFPVFSSHDEATLYQLSWFVLHSCLIASVKKCYYIFQVYEDSWRAICCSILLNAAFAVELLAFLKSRGITSTSQTNLKCVSSSRATCPPYLMCTTLADMELYCSFFYLGFCSRTPTIHVAVRVGRGPLLFLSTTSTN